MTASLKQQLRSGRPAIGCWIKMMSPLVAEVIAQAGHNLIMVDADTPLLRDSACRSVAAFRDSAGSD